MLELLFRNVRAALYLWLISQQAAKMGQERTCQLPSPIVSGLPKNSTSYVLFILTRMDVQAEQREGVWGRRYICAADDLGRQSGLYFAQGDDFKNYAGIMYRLPKKVPTYANFHPKRSDLTCPGDDGVYIKKPK